MCNCLFDVSINTSCGMDVIEVKETNRMKEEIMKSKLNVPSKSIILVFLIVFASIIFTVVCSPPSEDSRGYILKEPASDSDGVIQVLVLYDMEGLSGQKDWRTTEYANTEEYRKGRSSSQRM